MTLATETRLNNKFLAAGLFEARSTTGLDEGQLRRIAPSIFAVEKHESRSDKFQVIPTWEAIKGLMREGFIPVAAKQGGSRVPGKADFTKHLIRFRHADAVGSEEVKPEIILMNAADGTSAYKALGGGFRPICRNGLVSADLISEVRIGHTGNIVDKVIEGTFTVVNEVQKIVHTADHWQGISLNRDERDVMAEAVHTLRFADASEATRNAIQPRALLEAHRREDDGRWDLWHTFNTLQESAIRGGQTGHVVRERQGRQVEQRMTVRPIASIDGDTALNKALWVLADGMAKIKAGA
jgi:hypothetical protein